MSARIISIIILSLSFISFAYCQEKKYKLSYMYTDSDTLDYSCGGTARINVELTALKSFPRENTMTISGKMFYTKEKIPIDSSFGRILIADITKVSGETLLGKTETGLLRIFDIFLPDEKGHFSITIPSDSGHLIIFTGIGCIVIKRATEEIRESFNRNEIYLNN